MDSQVSEFATAISAWVAADPENRSRIHSENLPEIISELKLKQLANELNDRGVKIFSLLKEHCNAVNANVPGKGVIVRTMEDKEESVEMDKDYRIELGTLDPDMDVWFRDGERVECLPHVLTGDDRWIRDFINRLPSQIASYPCIHQIIPRYSSGITLVNKRGIIRIITNGKTGYDTTLPFDVISDFYKHVNCQKDMRLETESDDRIAVIGSRDLGYSMRISRQSDSFGVAMKTDIDLWDTERKAILFFGSPNSGKTTTLASYLRQTHTPDTYVIATCDELGSRNTLVCPCAENILSVRTNRNTISDQLMELQVNVAPRHLIVDEIVDESVMKTLDEVALRGSVVSGVTHADSLQTILRGIMGKYAFGVRETFLSGGIPALKMVKEPLFQVGVLCQGPNKWMIFHNLGKCSRDLINSGVCVAEEVRSINEKVYKRKVTIEM